MPQISTSLLQQRIFERIQQDGPLTFATYMRMALYEPDLGYYVTGPTKMGWQRGSDYFTSADLSTLFAHCMARQLFHFWEQLKRPTPFRVLEQGAGAGRLAQGVRAWTTIQGGDFAQALHYQTADISTGQDSLKAEEMPPIHVLLSNELVDALPVHIVEARDGQLHEVYVDVRDGQLCEKLDKPCSPEVATYLDTYRIPWRTFPEGWRAEINLDALRWLEQSVALLHSPGFLLTIDYGEKARKLYTRQRHHGTLLCYNQQHANEFPLRLPGQQDITAHVNFSSLIEHGRAQGLHLSRYTTQGQWLEDQGLSTELAVRRARDFSLADTSRATDAGQIALLGWRNLRQGAAILTDPAGMGNFKVLILRRAATRYHRIIVQDP